MPDATLTASDNVLVTCNDDATTNNSNYIRFRKWSTGVLLAEIQESGALVVTGPVQRAGIHDFANTNTGDGDISVFTKGSTQRLAVNYTSATGVIIKAVSGTDGIALRSRGHMYLDLEDGGGVAGDVNLEIRDNNKNPLFVFKAGSAGHQMLVQDTAGNYYVVLTHDKSASPEYAFVTVGNGSMSPRRRGIIHVINDGTADAEKPAVLHLFNKSGYSSWLWVDNAGKLRIHTSDPGTNDTLGTVVGTQT